MNFISKDRIKKARTLFKPRRSS